MNPSTNTTSDTTPTEQTRAEKTAAVKSAMSGLKVAVQQQQREELLERIQNDFVYHAPTPEKVETFGLLRNKFKELARVLIENVPPGRELSTALTSLETASFHANAGIARN